MLGKGVLRFLALNSLGDGDVNRLSCKGCCWREREARIPPNWAVPSYCRGPVRERDLFLIPLGLDVTVFSFSCMIGGLFIAIFEFAVPFNLNLEDVVGRDRRATRVSFSSITTIQKVVGILNYRRIFNGNEKSCTVWIN